MPNDKPMFVTWDENDLASKEKAYAQAVRPDSLNLSIAGNTFQNIGTNNVSVRESFSRGDYDFFRPGEQIPLVDKDIILACMQSYERVGIVRNVIDMMSEFACQGIDLVHPSESIQDFYREWFKKINGVERTERILNMLYRTGNVIIKRSTAKLKSQDVENLQRGLAADVPVGEPVKASKNEIPWSYTIYNPCMVEVYGEELAPFIGRDAFRYGIKIPETISKKLKNPKEAIEKQMISNISPAVINTAITGGKIFPLLPDKTIAIYYKRDDWQVWAKPMIYCILEDLLMLKKMKLADLAALDGAVSHIRLWKLGSLEHRILPTENAIARLADMLLNNVGGGSIDLIWGPELDFKETSTDVVQFLGEEKYKPILNAIFAGLGIPPSLTGLPTGQGVSNNYISLRTLIERLDYGRQLLTTFWEHEIKIVQKAMGFKLAAKIVFDQHTLQDEAAEKRLLIDLLDRDIISEEAVQERFDFIPEIEFVRRRRENKKRVKEILPPKAGPWHNPQRLDEIKKMWAQMGILVPKDFNVETSSPPPPIAPLGPNKKTSKDDPIGIEGQGRPVGIKDSDKRKKKEIKPRTTADLVEVMFWAESSQKLISDLVNPAYLESVKKKSLRALSSDEFLILEKTKFHILCNLKYMQKVDKSVIAEVLKSELKVDAEINKIVSIATDNFVKKEKSLPNIDIKRKIEASSVAIFFIGKNDEADNINNPTS